MVLSWGTAHLGGRTLVKRESPIRYLREYRSNRGMDYWHDIRDWLGGLPFEFATSEEVTAYLDANHDSFELVSTDIAKNLPTAVNVYVFERS